MVCYKDVEGTFAYSFVLFSVNWNQIFLFLLRFKTLTFERSISYLFIILLSVFDIPRFYETVVCTSIFLFIAWIFSFLYPTQRVAEGIMFLTRPSVSQSVSPVFLVSATPLNPLNRISWNFVDMKDIMCRCAYPQEILIPFFFSELRPFWT